MKTILVAPAVVLLTTLGALSSSAEAGKRVTPKAKAPPAAAPVSEIIPVKEKAIKFNFGEDYVLAPKAATAPSGEVEEVFEAQTVNQAQVSKVVQERIADLEYCWLRIPAARRVAGSANLKLMIEANGAVAGAFVDGSLPAGVGACIEKLAARWAFPVADAGCEIEHAISLNTKSDTLR